jgi:hypothetical protein
MSGSVRRRADAVLLLHEEGVTALADRARVVDWDRPACGTWTAAEVVRHGAGVAGWYHQWLDRALRGDDGAPFSSRELAERNEQLLAARSSQDPDVALEEFVTEAERYGRRTQAALVRAGAPVGPWPQLLRASGRAVGRG